MDGLVSVHVAFSLTELSQIEKKIWESYTPNFSTFINEFQYVTQSYNPTFHDIYMIFLSTVFSQRSTGESRIRLVPMQTKSTKLMTPTQLGLGKSQSGL